MVEDPGIRAIVYSAGGLKGRRGQLALSDGTFRFWWTCLLLLFLFLETQEVGLTY